MKILIAVVDATRARLFTYERTAESERLSESVDLVNLARRQRPSELFSDSRPGSTRTGGLQYTFDDHRDAHLDELDVAFARDAVGELAKLAMHVEASRLIVCASPNMLGRLRSVLDPVRGMRIDELARNYVKLTPPRLWDQLERLRLLPPRAPRPALTAN